MGRRSLLEGNYNASNLIQKLLNFGYLVTLRPHPESLKSHSKIIEGLVLNFSETKCLNMSPVLKICILFLILMS